MVPSVPVSYSCGVIPLIINIADELRAHAHTRGWFCLDTVTESGGRITRLGWYTPGKAHHRNVMIAPVPTDHTGAGWVFAETYEGDRHLGGYVSASIEVDHEAEVARVVAPENVATEGLATVLFRARTRSADLASPPVSCQTVVTWRDTDPEYLARVTRAVDEMRGRPDHVICLTTRATVTSEHDIDPLLVYARLYAQLRAPRAGIVCEGDVALVSASPETFIHIAAGVIHTSPMKGTRPRGTTLAEDSALREDLATSAKERQENIAVTRATCAELERVCAPGSVRMTAECRVITFAQVHQMVSDVTGRVRSGTTFGGVLEATFPGASMTGVPKAWAREHLAALETGPRGLYSGCYGWIDENGNEAQVAMAIRCAEVIGKVAYVGAGGGLTEASYPQTELAEVKLKAHAVLQALGARYP